MFKIIIIYELFFFLFWNIIYFGADLKDFAASESLAFIYYILTSMALGWVIINVIRYSFGEIPDPREQAKKNNISIPKDKKGAPPFSVDDNLFHTSTEGKVLENPKNSAPEYIFQRSISPEKAPNKATYLLISIKKI